jgi:8-oxo-dGTP pyrophosphatase MutT (NUDIX family)
MQHGLSDVVKRANNMPSLSQIKCRYFQIDGINVGLLPPKTFEKLQATRPSGFQIDDNLSFSPNLSGTERTMVLESLLLEWKEQGFSQYLKGWRNERFDISGSNVQCERSGLGLFGLRSYGCHVNGYYSADKIWVARRSLNKQTYPGKLDNLVGGGLTAKQTPYQVACRECAEEAGIDDTHSLKSAGAVSYWSVSEADAFWSPHTEFVYDLKLDGGFVPTARDGEVDEFKLMDAADIIAALKNDEFCPSAGLVMIDFLIRHGVLTPENEPNYLWICNSLRRKIEFPDYKALY